MVHENVSQYKEWGWCGAGCLVIYPVDLVSLVFLNGSSRQEYSILRLQLFDIISIELNECSAILVDRC